MRRFKLLVVTAVLLGPLLFGAVMAQARGWSWNSQINVEGADVRSEWMAGQGWLPHSGLPAAPRTNTNAASGTIKFMIGMGDSIGAGVQSGDANWQT